MRGTPIVIRLRSPHAASGRLLFFVSIAVGLYRTQTVSGRRKCLRSQGESQAGGPGRFVFGDRRIPVDEAPSGSAALPDGGIEAVARQARPQIPSAAGQLAVQCAALGRGGDLGGAGGAARPAPALG